MSALLALGAAATVVLLADQARRYRWRMLRSRLVLAARDLGLQADEGLRLSGCWDRRRSRTGDRAARRRVPNAAIEQELIA